MALALTALARALGSLFHPKMLVLLLLPLAVAVAFWAIAAWWWWDPIVGWLRTTIFDGTGFLNQVYLWLASWGLQDVRTVLPVLIALLMLFPLMVVTSTVLIGVLAMPAVLRFLSAGPYRDVERRGTQSPLPSVWNGVSSAGMFALGYLLTLPLWLIPPLALIVPWLWWSWLTARVMRFDSTVEHANADERFELMRARRREYLALSMMISALNYVPPLFLVTPVLSALAFGHYSLSVLRERRRHDVVRRDG